jgi:predicted peptidase
MKRPDLFAAAVPLCAMGDPARIGSARTVNVWAFHGAKDPGMPVDGTRALVAALKAAGGTVRYTEYPDAAHDVWTRAFQEPDLPDWLFAQRRHPIECTGLCAGSQ